MWVEGEYNLARVESKVIVIYWKQYGYIVKQIAIQIPGPTGQFLLAAEGYARRPGNNTHNEWL